MKIDDEPHPSIALRCMGSARPAVETADIPGWLWRLSGRRVAARGNFLRRRRRRSRRSPRCGGGALCGRNAALWIRTSPSARPAGVAAPQAGGYHLGHPTDRGKGRGRPKTPDESRSRRQQSAEWREIYLGPLKQKRGRVKAGDSRHAASALRLFLCRRAGRAISTGMCVADGDRRSSNAWRRARTRGGRAARKPCFAASKPWRSSGGSKPWALQAVATDTAAIPLYTRLGCVRWRPTGLGEVDAPLPLASQAQAR